MIDKTHNYKTPKNYICIDLPDPEMCKRIRSEGIPYPGCRRYSIAFSVNEYFVPTKVIKGWEGYSYQCPVVPKWDEDGPWSILQTDILLGE